MPRKLLTVVCVETEFDAVPPHDLVDRAGEGRHRLPESGVVDESPDSVCGPDRRRSDAVAQRVPSERDPDPAHAALVRGPPTNRRPEPVRTCFPRSAALVRSTGRARPASGSRVEVGLLGNRPRTRPARAAVLHERCGLLGLFVHVSSSLLALAPCRMAGCRTVVGPGPSGGSLWLHGASAAVGTSMPERDGERRLPRRSVP